MYRWVELPGIALGKQLTTPGGTSSKAPSPGRLSSEGAENNG
jgi:hypothetical protein